MRVEVNEGASAAIVELEHCSELRDRVQLGRGHAGGNPRGVPILRPHLVAGPEGAIKSAVRAIHHYLGGPVLSVIEFPVRYEAGLRAVYDGRKDEENE